MRAGVLIAMVAALAGGGAGAQPRETSIGFRPELGATQSFAVVHQTRYMRGEFVDGPGASYRLSVTVIAREDAGYRARVTVGAVSRLPAAVPGMDLDDALAQGLDGLTFELTLDAAGRPLAIEEWGEFRLELWSRALRAFAGDVSGALVSSTTLRLINSLDSVEAAQLIARPLAVMAEVRDITHQPSNLRVDVHLSARSGATLLPGPYEWDVSFEPTAVDRFVAARWQARPVARPSTHREDGTAVYRGDGWPTRLLVTTTTLSEGEFIERSLSVTMVGETVQ